MRSTELPTLELAALWAETAVDILFSEGDPFNGSVRRDSLVAEVRAQILKGLVLNDEPDLTEEEFAGCVSRARAAGPKSKVRSQPEIQRERRRTASTGL